MKKISFVLLVFAPLANCLAQATNGSSGNNSYHPGWFLGWDSPNSLHLKTNQSTRLKIFDSPDPVPNNGFTGIGDFSSSNPVSALHIFQNVEKEVYQLFNNRSTGFGEKGGFLIGLGGKSNADAVLASQSGSIQFYTRCCIIGSEYDPIQSPFPPSSANGNLRMVIKSSTGNVGIATENPGARLQINTGEGKISMDGMPNSDGEQTNYAINYIALNGLRNRSERRWSFECNTVHNGGVVMSSSPWGSFRISTIPSEYKCDNEQVRDDKYVLNEKVRFEITEHGQVLINKPGIPNISNNSNDNLKLIVKGGVLCEKVKVAMDGSPNWAWPDYVFEPGYKLKPLKEIEQFIAENNHLPGVPSANDIKKEGVDLAEMNARLLEKIEELTLHLISQGKEIESLKKTTGINY